MQPSAARASPLTMDLARRGAMLSFHELPRPVVLLARDAIMDFFAVAIAGAREPLADIVFAELSDMGGATQSSVIGRGVKMPAANAALLNGTAAHAHDYDDCSMALSGHPTAAILPAVLALAERRISSGSDVMTAYVAGYELACHIGSIIGPSSQRRGFHLTGTVGMLGAAAAAARLLGLNACATARAIGIAASQAGGLRVEGGTMCKPLHPGRAAQGGVVAALLASRGFVARIDILECERGFIDAYSSIDPRQIGRVPDGIEQFFLESNIIKRHAACFFTHAGIECAGAVRSHPDFDIDGVTEIQLFLHPETIRSCSVISPANSLEARRSLPYTAAMALLGIDGAIPDFFDRVTGAQSTKLDKVRLMITLEPDPILSHTAARITVRFRTGKMLAASRDAADPSDHDTAWCDPLRGKFNILVSSSLTPAQAMELHSMLDTFDLLPDISAVMTLAAGTCHS
ncbi:MmgE/PrpD family protein [Burkholderia sp. S171]|uniref:MmgE/PrpD family protein n=1 Tax=Burkholderia sp. S171 TaxID=1641860 RepID=UPI00131C7F91|nr:MmgE/PrpD family protein [Burkholderia sp. S171]